MREFKVVVLGDSLTMPRIEDGETILKEATWPYLLQKKLAFYLFDFGKRARTIDSINGEDFSEALTYCDPDLIIFQIGIVDAMPRIFSRREKRILGSSLIPPTLRNYLIERRKKNRKSIILNDPLKKVYTKPEIYQKNFVDFVARMKAEKEKLNMIVVPILVNEKQINEKSPNASANFQLYNSILREVCDSNGLHFLDIYPSFSVNESWFMQDGYHLNKKGNARLAELLEMQINVMS